MTSTPTARQASVLGAPMSGADLVAVDGFSDASIVVVRDPRTAVGALMAGWESGSFAADPQPAGWWGDRWSFTLIDSWRELVGEPLAVVCARQWLTLQVAAIRDAGPAAIYACFEELIGDPRKAEARLTGALGTGVRVLVENSGDPWARPHDIGEVLAGLEQSKCLWDEYLSLIDDLDPGAWGAGYRGEMPPPRKAPVAVSRPSEGTRFHSGFTPGVPELLARAGMSLLVTTYKAGQAIVARTSDGTTLDTHFTAVDRAMGTAVAGNRLAIGSADAVTVYCRHDGAMVAADPVPDAAWVPKAVIFTGDIAVHDMGWDAAGDLWLVNTRFSCLSVLDPYASFDCRWRPEWITGLAGEDRCHLNGMAMRDGHPAYVTALATTNTLGGWREHRGTGGVIVDITGPITAGSITGGEVVATGLSMPHSPRWHDGRLWFCESGTGALAVLEDDGTVTEVTRLPGFTRGLTFIGPYAIVGLSQVRESVFTGLPVTTSTGERNCGAWLVDTRTGATVGFLRFTGAVTEIFDVHAIPDRWPHLADPGELTKSCYALDPATLQHLAPHGGNHQ